MRQHIDYHWFRRYDLVGDERRDTADVLAILTNGDPSGNGAYLAGRPLFGPTFQVVGRYPSTGAIEDDLVVSQEVLWLTWSRISREEAERCDPELVAHMLAKEESHEPE